VPMNRLLLVVSAQQNVIDSIQESPEHGDLLVNRTSFFIT
jgi:hypothetical protein